MPGSLSIAIGRRRGQKRICANFDRKIQYLKANDLPNGELTSASTCVVQRGKLVLQWRKCQP